MEAPLEIRYAGVVIGRAQDIPSAEGDAPPFFIPIRDPMPVGTVLRLRAGDRETPVRVVRAVESADAATCGIQVRTIGEAEEVSPEFIPAPAVLAEKVKPATPTPVVETDVEAMQSDGKPAATPEEALVVSERAATVKISAPLEAAAEVAAMDPVPSPSGENAAIPEAVPLAIGSSMTGALENAAESIPVSEPASAAQAAKGATVTAPAGPQSESASAKAPEPEHGSAPATAPRSEDGLVATATTDTEIGSAAVAGEQTRVEDLPPARPIAEPSGRRKTKRRR